ncbi:MAG: hypothetical protein H7228_04060 [Polaromonas sp.]|nr:hypothetical protein [Polaromonas sp.]
MVPQLTDFVAMLGIDLVLCAGCMRLMGCKAITRAWAKWATAAFFVGLWLPVGTAQLPVLAYIRGISSDLSITLVVLAGVGLFHRLAGTPAIAGRERTAVFIAVSAAAVFLYPLALGWGDWDAYRPGWGSMGMWLMLLLMSLLCWFRGLRLLPSLVALALLAWTAGIMESGNLWDYLMDPWLVTWALLFVFLKCARRLFKAA